MDIETQLKEVFNTYQSLIENILDLFFVFTHVYLTKERFVLVDEQNVKKISFFPSDYHLF